LRKNLSPIESVDQLDSSENKTLNKKIVVAFLLGALSASAIFMLVQRNKSTSAAESVAVTSTAKIQSVVAPTAVAPSVAIPVPSMLMGDAKAGSIDTLTERLRARLEKEPNDVNGWVLLARSYHFLQRWDEAKAAFAKAKSLGYQGDEDQVPVGAEAAVGTGASGTADPVFEEIARAAQQRAAQLRPPPAATEASK
jgi:cytochrome c-type biogenesis protein CcmH/NrfG